MSEVEIENNAFYKYLKNNLQENLLRWAESYSIICIPDDSVLKNIETVICSGAFAASQVLNVQDEEKNQYNSELLGSCLTYEITIDHPSKAILWQEDIQSEIVVSKASVLQEHLINYEGRSLHLLLIDRPLPSMIEDDSIYINENLTYSLSSNNEAYSFLRRFKCHWPVLKWLEEELLKVQVHVLPSEDVDQIQCCLHGIILQSWDFLIKRHLVEVQMDTRFQDLLFRALDFFVVGFCHTELWNQVLNRCCIADKMVKARLTYLRSSDISPSQLGMNTDFCAPLPAALVEMASINGRGSAIEMLHCVRDSIEFIEAHTKETKALLCQYKDTDSDLQEWTLSEDEVITLMMVIVVRAQCFTLVSNIYYMTHYIFSVTEEFHPLWKSLSILRKCLERLMKLDIACLPPTNYSLRRELSLQDLMQVSSEVESVFEGNNSKEGSHSASDITVLNLQMRSLTSKIRQSTQAQSETVVDSRDSPSRRNDLFSCTVSSSSCKAQSPTKMQSIMEFVSTIPSSIRASFRRRQQEKRSTLPSDYIME